MNIFYEESGHFKAACIVQKNDSTSQADTQHGKRVKIKAANVFLEFDGDMDAFMQNAQDEAAAIETAENGVPNTFVDGRNALFLL